MPCHHQLGKARDLTFLAETHGQTWAASLRDLLVDMHAAAEEGQQRGVGRLPEPERTAWLIAYFETIRQGYAALPLPDPDPPKKKKGRKKQHPAQNLLEV